MKIEPIVFRAFACAFLLAGLAGIPGCAARLSGSRAVPARDVEAFIARSGINLPWLDYGWDLGACPWGSPPGGFHRKRRALERDFAFMRDRGVAMCRVFLFCDFRTGLEKDGAGNILGLDDYVIKDMEVLVEVALAHGIRLIPVLTDYMLADGVSLENGVPVGEHPEYISCPERRGQLIENALWPFIEKFGASEAVYAWDIMNEPRFAVASGAVSADQVRVFIGEVAALIRRVAPGARVTVGNYGFADTGYYCDEACDLVQVHFYDRMEGLDPMGRGFDTPASRISGKPVFFGELEPADIGYKLDTALANGYTGVLFWSLNAGDGYDFRSFAGRYRAWVERRLRGADRRRRN